MSALARNMEKSSKVSTGVTGCSYPLVEVGAAALTTAIKQHAHRSGLIWGPGVTLCVCGVFSFLLLLGGWKRACVFLR